MCSNSYTAEALVPASALTAKKKNIEKKPKVYRSSKLWSKHTAGKVDVSLLGEGIAEMNFYCSCLHSLKRHNCMKVYHCDTVPCRVVTQAFILAKTTFEYCHDNFKPQ